MKSLIDNMFESVFNDKINVYLRKIITEIVNLDNEFKQYYENALTEADSKKLKEYLIENGYLKQVKDIKDNTNLVKNEWLDNIDENSLVLIYGDSLDKPFTVISWTWNNNFRKGLLEFAKNSRMDNVDYIKKSLVEPADEILRNK